MRGWKLPAGQLDSVNEELLRSRAVMEAEILDRLLGDVGLLEFSVLLNLQGIQRMRRWCERVIAASNYDEALSAVGSFKQDSLVEFLGGKTDDGFDLDASRIAERRKLLESSYYKGAGVP